MAPGAFIDVAGIAVPRLAFGLGSLMKWAPNHAHPIPTDSSVEIRQALAAGFRHFNTGDLYTNNASAAEAIKASGLKREELFFSLKVNTYALLGCKGKEDMMERIQTEIERYEMNGYVDLLQLHFPPRGYPGNLSNREAWSVLEQLKDKGHARLIGVSNWTLADYPDIIDAPDLKHKPQVNEYELNPFLVHRPEYAELRSYEAKHRIVNMNYGFLTVLSGRLPLDRSTNLRRALNDLSAKTMINEADLVLSWAYHTLNGIVVTTTTKSQRAFSVVKLFSSREVLPQAMFDDIEKAAKADGYVDKAFYNHPHMNEAAARIFIDSEAAR